MSTCANSADHILLARIPSDPDEVGVRVCSVHRDEVIAHLVYAYAAEEPVLIVPIEAAQVIEDAGVSIAWEPIADVG